jgi:hypothetical protein
MMPGLLRNIVTTIFSDLAGLAGGTDEVTKDGDIGAVGADATSVHGQAKKLGLVEIYTGIIKFRKAKASSREHAIEAGGIDRPRRAVALPGAARQLIKLLPIAFVPSGH